MKQLSSDGSVQAEMTGAQRIYSRKDTAQIVKMATEAKSQRDILALGKFVYDATKRQDAAEPQYTNIQ